MATAYPRSSSMASAQRPRPRSPATTSARIGPPPFPLAFPSAADGSVVVQFEKYGMSVAT
uniref:Uncharacterized protein n=1 Tax=Leersia perrieri TaxID=77586 RepID=A0A0D9XK39_9ORYZ